MNLIVSKFRMNMLQESLNGNLIEEKFYANVRIEP